MNEPAPRTPPGLCASCAEAERTGNRRGSEFILCALSRTDPRFPRYPRLPGVELRRIQGAAGGAKPATSKRNIRTIPPINEPITESTTTDGHADDHTTPTARPAPRPPSGASRRRTGRHSCRSSTRWRTTKNWTGLTPARGAGSCATSPGRRGGSRRCSRSPAGRPSVTRSSSRRTRRSWRGRRSTWKTSSSSPRTAGTGPA